MATAASPYRDVLPRWLEEAGVNPFIGAGPLAAVSRGPQMIRLPLPDRWGRLELMGLASRLGREGPAAGSKARPVSSKVFSLGRYRGGDTVKPHHPIEEATVEGRPAIDLTALLKLLRVLGSQVEGGTAQLPW